MHTHTAGSPETAWVLLGRKAILWLLFFLVCMGLGYPTLNRYDPRLVAGLYDTRAYYSLVTGAPLQGDQSDLAHRVLVPFLAKPIYWLANGHLRTWDPVFFALLAINSFFIATTAFLLVGVSHRVVGDHAVARLSGFIYVANFAVANFNLSGYVDSAVNCMMMAIAWTLLTDRWWLLPLWGIAGAFAKETFVPLSAVFALAWWLTARRRGAPGFSRLAWIAVMAGVGLVTVTLLMMRGSHPYTPLSFAGSRASMSSGLFFLSGLVRCLAAREFLFVFGWLLPLGLLRLGRLPREWVTGSACAAFAALAMGAYDDALGNATRAIFSACGPVLSLSVALFLNDSAHLVRNQDSRLN
jgi:hypothetical protein